MGDSLYNDAELLERLAAGDDVAFKALFDRYRGRLFVYISRFIKSDQVAEELVMDVFLKIWLGRELVIQIDHFNAFLFRVARNKCIDFLRSAARDARFTELLWDGIRAAPGEHADAAVLLQEYQEKIRQAVALLSPQRRKVYQLSREQEYTHDQIARQLNISKATVNNHIVEAQGFIRKYLVKNLDLAVLFLVAGKIS